jgi:hypothetical protein
LLDFLPPVTILALSATSRLVHLPAGPFVDSRSLAQSHTLQRKSPAGDITLLKQVIAVLHMTNANATEAFYCGRLGFQREFNVPASAAKRDPCYLGVSRDGTVLHLSSHAGDGVIGGVVYFLSDHVDALHAEFVAKNVPIHIAPVAKRGACASSMCSIRMATAFASALQ